MPSKKAPKYNSDVAPDSNAELEALLEQEIGDLDESPNDSPALTKLKKILLSYGFDESLFDEFPVGLEKRPQVKKRLEILETSRQYLNDLGEARIAGNELRHTQKMIAIGFEQFIGKGLVEDALMGHVVHPGGTGKTNAAVMLSNMAGGRTVFIAHNKGINAIKAFQDHEDSLEESYRLFVGQCFGGKNEVEADIVVAHFASQDKWLETVAWDEVNLIVVDEADINALSRGRRKLLEQLAREHGIPIVGMSATEEQGSGKKLQDVFPAEISRLGMPDALPRCLDLGIVPQMKFADLVFNVSMQVDVDKLRKASDLPDASVENLIRTSAWVELILDHYQKNHAGQPAMIVFRDNHLNKECLKMAKKRGLRAAAYVGDTSDEARLKMQEKLTQGKLDLLFGSKLIGRGLHVPVTEVVYNSTVTWSPQIFWQANARGGSIDAETLDKVSHIYAVLPRRMLYKSTGRLLPLEFRPLSNAAFFEPDYFEGEEERLIDLDQEYLDNIELRREGRTEQSGGYELGEYQVVRSIRRVASVTRGLREKPAGSITRGAMTARLISLLEGGEFNTGLIRKLTRMHTSEMRAIIADMEATRQDPAEPTLEKYEAMESGQNMEDSTYQLPPDTPMITLKEEKKLLANLDNPEAREILVQAYLPLIESIARKMCPQECDIPYYVNWTVAGLLDFISKKQVRGGLTAYVMWISLQRMQRLACNESQDVRLPIHGWEAVWRTTTIREEIRQRIAGAGYRANEVTDEEVAEELGIEPEELSNLPKRIDKDSYAALRKAQLYRGLTHFLVGHRAYTKLVDDPDSYVFAYDDSSAVRISKVLPRVAERSFWEKPTPYFMSPNELSHGFGVAEKEVIDLLRAEPAALGSLLNLKRPVTKTEADWIRNRIAADYRYGYRPTLQQVAKSLEISGFDEKLRAYASEQVPYDTDDAAMNECFAEFWEKEDEDMDADFLRSRVGQLLKTLPPREELVINLRFGIGRAREFHLDEVGRQFKVTRERVRQIEIKALRKLRHPSRTKWVNDFWNDPKI